MARRDSSPDFIEALARGLDVIRAFEPRQPAMSLAAVADASRPAAAHGAADPADPGADWATCASPWTAGYELTPRVLELGMSYVLSRSLWEVARPHMERAGGTHPRVLVHRPARRAGHRLRGQGRGPEDRRAGGHHRHQVPGHADLAGQGAARGAAPRRRRNGCSPSRAGPGSPRAGSPAARSARPRCGRSGRAAGRSPTSSSPPGIRSVAAPLRDGDGQVIAALNVNTHAAETPVEVLTGEYLPLLLQTAGAISADWAACQAAPQVTVPPGRLSTAGAAAPGPAVTPPSTARLRGTHDRIGAGQLSDMRTEGCLSRHESAQPTSPTPSPAIGPRARPAAVARTVPGPRRARAAGGPARGRLLPRPGRARTARCCWPTSART